jgi:Transposase and inactivated derivatives
MMERWLVDDLRRYGSLLAAFVVMPEHLHWVCTVPAGQDVSWLVNRVKSNSGKALNNDLTPQERAALSQRAGLNGRSFWQRSFRSCPLDSDRQVAQKCEYIHLNPVRRGSLRARSRTTPAAPGFMRSGLGRPTSPCQATSARSLNVAGRGGMKSLNPARVGGT